MAAAPTIAAACDILQSNKKKTRKRQDTLNLPAAAGVRAGDNRRPDSQVPIAQHLGSRPRKSLENQLPLSSGLSKNNETEWLGNGEQGQRAFRKMTKSPQVH